MSEDNVPAAGVDAGTSSRCLWCNALVRHTKEPYGAKHDAPVCQEFIESMKKPVKGTTTLPDFSGWTVDEALPGETEPSPPPGDDGESVPPPADVTADEYDPAEEPLPLPPPPTPLPEGHVRLQETGDHMPGYPGFQKPKT